MFRSFKHGGMSPALAAVGGAAAALPAPPLHPAERTAQQSPVFIFCDASYPGRAKQPDVYEAAAFRQGQRGRSMWPQML